MIVVMNNQIFHLIKMDNQIFHLIKIYKKLKQSLKEEFLKINEQGLENDKFMLYINKIFENKLINDNSFLYNFLKDKKIQPHEIIYMINLLIDDKNYENQLLNDINDIKKIN